METAVKWIRQRQHFSSPLFALLLMVNVFILPSYRAAAQIEEPVQPMAQTGDQVVDALNAVEAGVEVDKAFDAQPLPYRELVKTWKSTYEELFEIPYPAGGDPYLVGSEVNDTTLNFGVQGSTQSGQDFELDFLSLGVADYSDPEIGASSDDIAILDSVSTVAYGAVVVLRTVNAEIHVAGSLVQWGVGESRVREFVPLQVLDWDIVEDFYSGVQLVQEEGQVDGPVPYTCESCTAHARADHDGRMDLARIALNAAIAAATAGLVAVAPGCLIGGFTIPFFGQVAGAACLIAACATAAAAVASATGVAAIAAANSRSMLATALEHCYIDFPGCRPV